MKIIACRVGQKAVYDDVYNHLYHLQRFVGGYIETISSPTGFVIVCDEEGQLKNLPDNPTVDPITAAMWRWPVVIKGNYLICGQKGDELTDIPNDQLTNALIDILNEVR